MPVNKDWKLTKIFLKLLFKTNQQYITLWKNNYLLSAHSPA